MSQNEQRRLPRMAPGQPMDPKEYREIKSARVRDAIVGVGNFHGTKREKRKAKGGSNKGKN